MLIQRGIALSFALIIAAGPQFSRASDPGGNAESTEDSTSAAPIISVETNDLSGAPVKISMTALEIPSAQISDEIDAAELAPEPSGNDQVIVVDDVVTQSEGMPDVSWRVRIKRAKESVKEKLISAKELARALVSDFRKAPFRTAVATSKNSLKAIYSWLLDGSDMEKYREDPVQNFQYGRPFKLCVRIQQAIAMTTLIFTPKIALSGKIMRVFLDLGMSEYFSLSPGRWSDLMSYRARKKVAEMKAKSEQMTPQAEQEFIERGRRNMDTWVGQTVSALLSQLALFGLNKPNLTMLTVELSGILFVRYIGGGGVRNIFGRYWNEKKNGVPIPISERELIAFQQIPKLWSGPLENVAGQLFRVMGTWPAIFASLNVWHLLEHLGPLTSLLTAAHLLDPVSQLSSAYAVPIHSVRLYFLIGGATWLSYYWRSLSDGALKGLSRSLSMIGGAAKRAVRTDLITIGPYLKEAMEVSNANTASASPAPNTQVETSGPVCKQALADKAS